MAPSMATSSSTMVTGQQATIRMEILLSTMVLPTSACARPLSSQVRGQLVVLSVVVLMVQPFPLVPLMARSLPWLIVSQTPHTNGHSGTTQAVVVLTSGSLLVGRLLPQRLMQQVRLTSELVGLFPLLALHQSQCRGLAITK